MLDRHGVVIEHAGIHEIEDQPPGSGFGGGAHRLGGHDLREDVVRIAVLDGQHDAVLDANLVVGRRMRSGHEAILAAGR